MWEYLMIIALASSWANKERDTPIDAGEESLDLPRKFVDTNHPRPEWVDALASKSRSSAITAFKRLDNEQQVEFAVFMRLDQHPADLEWSFLVAEQGAKMVPLLEKSISREVSDRFVLGLMEIVYIVARKYGLAAEPTLYKTMRARVDRMEDPTTKWYGTELVARIARDERRAP